MTSGEPADPTPMPVITQDMYASLPSGELVLFAVQLLHADGVPATAEEIVSTCFKLFPHRFSLKNYFYWPDSAHVAQSLKYAKEKNYVKETAAEGYVLRPAGRKLARQAAKAMRIPFPMPPKVKKTVDSRPEMVANKQVKPAPVKKKKQAKKVEKKAAKKAGVKKTKPAEQSGVKEFTPATTVTSRPTPKPKSKKVVRRKAAGKKVTAATKKTIAKPKAQPKKTVSKPAPKKAPAHRGEQAPAKISVKKVQAATQLPLLIQAEVKEEAKPVVKRKPAQKKIQTQAKKEANPVIVEVSKEEKVKAGRVIQMVERSDAYRQYKKLGTKVRISEFDFRNMLFATMESSAETLRRNVDLFKRYAGIHNRADLISFLDFAEGSFAPLLKTQAKTPAGKK